jgi:sn-glycerol 3-phosphate transport system ATP-binding protein
VTQTQGNFVEVDAISKAWGRAQALADVSFVADSGMFVTILGPSGCGKSTLLRVIAGLEHPDSGRILIAGKDVTNLAPAARMIGMVFQNYALFPHLSVADNILFGLKLRGTPKAERQHRLEETVELLELAPYLGRRPSQLSGGQQQRVALGRAIISGRQVILMDEPLSNLDAMLRHDMRNELRALQTSLGLTVIYVTHDQAEALSMSDRVILMRDGAVEQAASAPEIYRRPATLFAAGFIGAPPTNLIALEPQDAGMAVARTDRIVLPKISEAPLKLGIRPEDLREPRDGDVRLVGRVTDQEYLGTDLLTTLSLGGAGKLVVRRHNSSVLGDNDDALELGAPIDAIHLFDARAGARREDLIRALHSQMGRESSGGSADPVHNIETEGVA